MYDIEDIIEIQIGDPEDDSEDAKMKAICGFNLDSNDRSELRVAIKFCNPRALTTDLAEPDKLQVTFLKPKLIIDAETNEYLEEA